VKNSVWQITVKLFASGTEKMVEILSIGGLKRDEIPESHKKLDNSELSHLYFVSDDGTKMVKIIRLDNISRVWFKQGDTMTLKKWIEIYDKLKKNAEMIANDLQEEEVLKKDYDGTESYLFGEYETKIDPKTWYDDVIKPYTLGYVNGNPVYQFSNNVYRWVYNDKLITFKVGENIKISGLDVQTFDLLNKVFSLYNLELHPVYNYGSSKLGAGHELHNSFYILLQGVDEECFTL
jgi:hypothetical protein